MHLLKISLPQRLLIRHTEIYGKFSHTFKRAAAERVKLYFEPKLFSPLASVFLVIISDFLCLLQALKSLLLHAVELV